MSELLPIQFTVTDIADLSVRPSSSCQWTLVQIKHEEDGARALSQAQHLDYSSALREKRDIKKTVGFDPEVDEIQIYRITREV